MHCSNCNKEINDNINFCPNCGEKINKKELHKPENKEDTIIDESKVEKIEPIKTKPKDDYLFLKIFVGSIIVIVGFLWIYGSVINKENKQVSSVSSVAEEETNTRKITDEEQKYINLILDKKYNTVMEQTRNIDSEVTNDYYRIAFALSKYEEANKNSEQKESIDLEIAYSNVSRNLEQVKHIPEQLKEQLEEVKNTSIKKEKEYSLKTDEEMKQEDLQKKEEIKQESEQDRINRLADYRTLNPQNVSIGMTREEVLTDGWGRPNDINKTTNLYGTSEQWVYSDYKYLYFEDGILTSIQE